MIRDTENIPLDEREIERRRDDAVRRALSTPPQPKKAMKKTTKSGAKKNAAKGR